MIYEQKEISVYSQLALWDVYSQLQYTGNRGKFFQGGENFLRRLFNINFKNILVV